MSNSMSCLHPSFETDLRKLLSAKASLVVGDVDFRRWSDFNEVKPGAIMVAGTEQDVQVAVRYCAHNSIKLVVQSGCHGGGLLAMNHDGVIISLRQLNKTAFDASKNQIYVQGGCTVKEVLDAAYENNVQVVAGTCNSVGALGATLGGGFGNLSGLYGLAIDNLISVDIVLADGILHTTTAQSNPDLWWAIRGAGPNFGVVVAARYKTYPVAREENVAFTGELTFSHEKLENIIEAINNMISSPKMYIMIFLRLSGPPDLQPIVSVVPWYLGSEEEAREAYASLYAVGPSTEMMFNLPANHWNDSADPFCTPGGRKPFFGASFDTLNAQTWRKIYDSLLSFTTNHHGTGFSFILLECHSMQKISELADSSGGAYPWRNRKFSSIAIPWYESSNLDDAAIKFGTSVKDLLRAEDDLPPASYINFASRDEPNQVVYGDNVERLRLIKQRYDPQNVFSSWFSLI